METGTHIASARAAPLGFALKTGYATGQLVELVVGSMLNVFVLFYVTVVCGLPGAWAGVALGAGLVADAVLEPLIGSLSDGWRSRWGRRVPFMAVSLLPIVVVFNLIFALPESLHGVALFLWLTTLSLAMRMALSLYALPFQALGAELTDDYAERSSIASWRWGIGVMGTVAVIVLGYGVFLSGPGGTLQREQYPPLTMSLSLLIILGGMFGIRAGLTTRHRQHHIAPAAMPLHRRVVGEVREVFRSASFRVLFASSLCFNIGAGVTQALQLHVGTFFWKLDAAQLQVLSMAAVFGLVLGAPLASVLAARVEKRTLLLAGKLGMFVFNALPATLKLLGVLTLAGTPLTVFLGTSALLGSVFMALSIIAFLAIVPDAADEHEHVFGTRREGLYLAGWSFASKSATGAGVLIAGVVLQLIAFPVDVIEHGGASAHISETTLAWLAIAGGPGAALLTILGVVFVLMYRLDRPAHMRIVAELTQRRGAAVAVASAG